MNDTDNQWSTETVAPAPKRRLPAWLWGCGLGCGLLLVLGLLLMFLAYRGMARMVDPELQWAALEEEIALAERPADVELVGLPWWIRFSVPGYRGGWALTSEDETSMATLLSLDAGPAASDWKDMFAADERAGQVEFFGSPGIHDPELGTLTTQGRELRVLRYRTMPEDAPPEGEDETAPEGTPEGSEEKSVFREIKAGIEASMRASAARVDLTPEPAGDVYIVLEYRKPGSLERVSDEELAAFLEVFDLSPR